MNARLKFSLSFVFWAGLAFSLHAQSEKPPAAPVVPAASANPMTVATELSRELEGTAGTGDKPLALEECLLQVFQKNPEIQRKKTEIEQALGQRLIYRSIALPDLTVGGIGGEQGERSTNPVTPAQEIALATGFLRQPLFEASIPASYRAGTIGVIVAQQDFQATASTILNQARIAYYTAIFARSSWQLLHELETPLNENIQLEKDRVTTGLSARSSLITAEVRKLQLVPQREAAWQRYQQSLVILAQLMGSDLKNPASLKIYPKGPLPFTPVSFNLRLATEEAMKNRPDLQLLRNLVTQTGDTEQIAKGGYYPKIDLQASGQYLPQTILQTSNSLDSTTDQRTSEVLMGPTFTWHVIDTGVVGGEALRQQKVKENYEVQLSALEQDVPRDLSVIFRALNLSQNRINALASSVRLAEENLKTVQDMISLGSATQLDFVNARNSLIQTKQGMLNAFYDNGTGLANLDLATGRYLRYVNLEPRKN